MVPVAGGRYHVWTKRVGSAPIRLLLLHGGPGLENFYLYGHSWGGMLAYEYARKYGNHLQGMIVPDMVANIPGYVAYAAKLRAGFPEDVRKTLDRYEAAGQFEAPEYQKVIVENLYAKHVCRLDPWPEPVERGLKFMNGQDLQLHARPQRVRHQRHHEELGPHSRSQEHPH